MQFRPMKPIPHTHQSGASLIEVLVAILILSFGMLALGSMMSLAVQLPKLSAYRATAAQLASSYIERMRANPNAFTNNSYTAALNESSAWSFTAITFTSPCSYPACTAANIASIDISETRQAVRRELPGGDMIMKCYDSAAAAYAACTKATYGDLWIVWQEPNTISALNPTAADQCPSEATTAYSNPEPRCLYIRFKIE
jgi:type IV pilus assembly protein PilV